MAYQTDRQTAGVHKRHQNSPTALLQGGSYEDGKYPLQMHKAWCSSALASRKLSPAPRSGGCILRMLSIPGRPSKGGPYWGEETSSRSGHAPQTSIYLIGAGTGTCCTVLLLPRAPQKGDHRWAIIGHLTFHRTRHKRMTLQYSSHVTRASVPDHSQAFLGICCMTILSACDTVPLCATTTLALQQACTRLVGRPFHSLQGSTKGA